MKYCTKCGAALDDDAKFCTSCGQVPDNEEVPPAVPPQAPYQQPQTPYQQPPVSHQAPSGNTYNAGAQPNIPYRNPSPTYNPTPQPTRTKIFGKLSFIFGLIGLILSGVFGLIGLIPDTMGTVSSFCWWGISLGIAGLVMGIIGKKKNPDDPKARTGFLLSLIAIIAGFVLFIVGIIIAAASVSSRRYWY